jgi:hypothetical protein
VIRRIDLCVETIAACNTEPVGIRDPGLLVSSLAWTTPRSVILQTTVNVVRFPHVHANRIKLRGGNSVDELPVLALIVANVHAAIVADQQVVAVRRIDPDRVVIDVGQTGLQ